MFLFHLFLFTFPMWLLEIFKLCMWLAWYSFWRELVYTTKVERHRTDLKRKECLPFFDEEAGATQVRFSGARWAKY